jgi:lincosamide nucleotidyltransferase A/C/D/E
MKYKEETTIDDLFFILNHLELHYINYWVEGGWGVDIIIGKQHCTHRDIDIDFDGAYEKGLIESLIMKGYQITSDLRPTRIELNHPLHGYLDLHPLRIGSDGTIKQASLEAAGTSLIRSGFQKPCFKDVRFPVILMRLKNCFTLDMSSEKWIVLTLKI